MTKKRVAFLFPGQGAQGVGMGRDFYDSYACARELFQGGDERLGRSLSRLIFEGPIEELTETHNSQPAIYLNSLATLKVINEQFPNLEPVVCAGLSLGEYTALTAGGKIDFASCLPLVQYRGEVMSEACKQSQGTMAALMGLSAEQVEKMVSELQLPHDLWVANFNAPGQTVISGTQRGVEAGMEAAKKLGARRAIALKVHGAFHSGLMSSAEKRLAERIFPIEFTESRTKIVMNVSGDFVENPEEIKRNLIAQVTSPVRWEQSLRALLPLVDCCVEIGWGKTLAGMVRQLGSVPTHSISKIEDLEKLVDL